MILRLMMMMMTVMKVMLKVMAVTVVLMTEAMQLGYAHSAGCHAYWTETLTVVLDA